MPLNTKLKVLLVQMFGTELWFRPSVSNIPLAAGYLKSMAFKEGLLDDVDIEILDLDKRTTLPADAKLIDLIISKAPHVLGFSLYAFNALQSLFIAGAVKNKLPNTLIVVGGPEVTMETEYIVNHPAVDMGCIGQGEMTFVEILRAILEGKRNYHNIPGIYYRASESAIPTPPRIPIKDLNQIPSPYLMGFIDLDRYETACIETYRGCIFNCAYCAYGTRPLGYFSPERVFEELRFIAKKGERVVHILDSDFYSRNFYEICDKLLHLKSEHKTKLKFITEFNIQNLNEERIDLIAACNFKWVDMGLQSIHPQTLRNVNRAPVDMERFIHVIEMLKKRDIECGVGIILGLPRDTLDDFKETVDFLRHHKIPFSHQVLQLFPGTKLWRQAEKFGIQSQKKPPYLTVEAPYLSKSNMEEAILYASGKPEPACFDNLLMYCNTEFPRSSQKAPGAFDDLNEINRVVVQLDPECRSSDGLRKMGEAIAPRVCQPFSAWFQCRNPEKSLDHIEAFFAPIRKRNPFLPLHLIVETANPLPVDVVDRLKEQLERQQGFFSDSRRMLGTQFICGVVKWTNTPVDDGALAGLSERFPFYWALEVENHSTKWQASLREIFHEKRGKGLLLDFHPGENLAKIAEVLDFIKKCKEGSNKEVLFRNLAVAFLARVMGLYPASKYYFDPFKHFESVIHIDEHLNIVSTSKPDKNTLMDLIFCRMDFQDILKNTQQGPSNE